MELRTGLRLQLTPKLDMQPQLVLIFYPEEFVALQIYSKVIYYHWGHDGFLPLVPNL